VPAESVHGEGHYEVNAELDGVRYAGSLTRVYNGCYVDSPPVTLRKVMP
jgi:hypothetical protein